MKLQLRIEAVNESGQVFSCQSPDEFPENKVQRSFFTLEGSFEEILQKGAVILAMVAGKAGDDTKMPAIFAEDKELIQFANPYFKNEPALEIGPIARIENTEESGMV